MTDHSHDRVKADRTVKAVEFAFASHHVLNLFVAAGVNSERGVKTETVHGYNVRFWCEQSLSFRVVGDINLEELQEFVEKCQAALL